jgi:phosphoribosylformylglycinamidine synthase subunit PurL
MEYRVFAVDKMTNDIELSRELKQMGLGMTAGEARKVASILGRNPSIVELFIFDIEWSEHCSYKSSKRVLGKYLPTDASNVILGPGEDAGIVTFTEVGGVEYAMVIAHESHNHPSQVLPVEGAATGIGGIVRDVDCMGAHVCAVADGLRFGDLSGDNKPRTRWIVNGVVDGIWQYGNALGVPNLGGDVYFDASFDDNCLVNVVCMGVVPKHRIIRSRAPEEAKHRNFDLILVGKTTDASGFGGVTFASEILDESEEDRSIGAVQVHDPFLKNILITKKANQMVLDLAYKKGIPIGMKDLGGGGLACASSEICSAAGVGAQIHIDRVHTSMENLPPEVIACGETQERFILAVPPEFTEEVLRIYNDVWELPQEANGACARVIGHTLTEPQYRLFFNSELICDAPIHEITSGIVYDRTAKPRQFTGSDPIPSGSNNSIAESAVIIAGSPACCSRYPVFRHYDSEVQGCAVIRPGESDAGIIAPLVLSDNCAAGIALSVDGNPFIGEIDPYWGGATAVAEAMRNVIATGAVPRALTDCLCYGNPEKPEAFWEFEQGVRGIADAANRLWQFGTRKEPVPVVSGNVSFYNESALGQAIKPSPIIACFGVIEDSSRAVSMQFKETGNRVVLIGERRDEMGGSAYFRECHGVTGIQPLTVDFDQECKDMHAVMTILGNNLACACHDISDGGLLIALAEMCLSQRHDPDKGIRIELPADLPLPVDRYLFSETGGFVLEVPKENLSAVIQMAAEHDAVAVDLGSVTENINITLSQDTHDDIVISLETIRSAWVSGLEECIS